MPRLSEVQTFDRTISQLIMKRREYAKGLASIDALFAKYGIRVNDAGPAAAAPRKVAASSPTKARQRRRFAQTASDFVLAFVKTQRNPTTAEVNASWKKSGRGGTADNMLGSLVKDKKLKRVPIKDGRGSTYGLI